MRVTERPFTGLRRRPNDVTRDVEDGDVVLRRRESPDLRLSRADREADRTTAFAALARALRNLAVHTPTAFEEAVGEAISWVEFLPAAERRAFVDEFSRLAVAAAELDPYSELTQVLQEWRATAEIHADPRLARRLRRPISADGDHVGRPAG
jgi:hypothetical protein